MTIYKRSEITSEQLKIWEEESKSEWILKTAKSKKELIEKLSVFYEVESKNLTLTDEGNIILNGMILLLKWRESNGLYFAFEPAKDKNNKIVRGPWN